MTSRPRPARRRRRRSVAPLVASCAALACAAVGGCMVGPNYQRPDPKLQGRWTSLSTTRPTGPAATQVSAGVAGRADTVRWWRNFQDPVLDALVQEAVASNLDLAAAEARVRQARAQRAIATGLLFPSVDATSSYRRSGTGARTRTDTTSTRPSGTTDAPITTGVLGTTASRSNDQFQLGFDASWEIDVFGGTRRSVEAADATLWAGLADIQDVRVTLVSEVAVNYFTLRSAQQRLGFAVRNLQIQQQSLEVTRRRFSGGLVSGLDLAQAEAQIATTESQIPALEQQSRTAVFDLALLLGREPADLADPTGPSAFLPAGVPLLAADLAATRTPLMTSDPETLRNPFGAGAATNPSTNPAGGGVAVAAEPVSAVNPPAVPAGLPSDLLRRRPDIRRAEEQLHAATANIGVATADLFPRFTLTGTFGTENSKFRGLFNWGNTLWSFGPNISWNLFDAGRIRANIGLAEAQRDEQFVAYRRTVLTALRDAEQSLTAYDFEQRRRVGLRTAVGANRRAVSISQRLYAQGQTEFVNVLTAQQALLNSEDALVQSDSQVASNLVAVYKALGGGWEDPPADRPTTVPAPIAAANPTAGGTAKVD